MTQTTTSISPISRMVEKEKGKTLRVSFCSHVGFSLPRNIVDRVRLRPGSVSDFIDFFYSIIYIPTSYYGHDLIGRHHPVIITRRSPPPKKRHIRDSFCQIKTFTFF